MTLNMIVIGPRGRSQILLEYKEIKETGHNLFYSTCAASIPSRNKIPGC